jgi:hypothetical protein
VFDNPELIACCVVGDGEAGTGPAATSWHANKFLNPATDGPVLPILHLNGYKIANPTVLARVYLPPDANCLLSVADHCLRSLDYVNVVVAGKQPSLDWLAMDDAVRHCTRGAGIWEWASNDEGEPDVVLACCGDVPTLEALAAVDLIRQHLPELKVRVVNVVDLMCLQPETEHPHGMSDAQFDSLFTADRPVIFAHHGYPWLIHRLCYRRHNHENFHVRGYKEEGTTTTPFDMVMLNDLDRFHLVTDVIDRVPGLASRAGLVRQGMVRRRRDARAYTRLEGEDPPDPAAWVRRWGLRRFGFHGISHAYASRRTAELLGAGTGDRLRVVTCHLGAGASLAAVAAGRCVDTTMGFTPLEGLIMATRSGTVDPGLILWLETHAGVGSEELSEALERHSGLLALSGTSDMAEVIGRAEAGEGQAALAPEAYLHRLRGHIAAMAAALGGLDALTFTGGVGEHAPLVRQRAGAGLAFLGVAIDPVRNRATGSPPDVEIGREGAPVRSFVIEAREDREIARDVRRLLG